MTGLKHAALKTNIEFCLQEYCFAILRIFAIPCNAVKDGSISPKKVFTHILRKRNRIKKRVNMNQIILLSST